MMLLDELVDYAIAFARRELIGKPDAQLMPCWVIQGSKRTSIVGTPFDGDRSKDYAAFIIRKMLKDERATSYSYIAEAWVAHEDAKNPTGLAPRDRQDRREVVIVLAQNRGGEGKTRTWEIVRGPDGVVTELKADPVPESMEFGGRFHNLFDEGDSR